MKKHLWVILSGILIGALAVGLTLLGNPANMGFCIACFLRDSAGSLKRPGARVGPYFRPEVVGILLGAMAISLFTKEHQSKSGSSPLARFFVGMMVMIGALVFLGCPLRMILRIGGGDWNALLGLVGFALGTFVGLVGLG